MSYLIHYGIKGMKWGVLKSLKDVKRNLRTKIGNATGHYARNNSNTNLPQNDVMAEKMGWRKLSSKESAMHQNNRINGVENSKWVSPDGHKEVVFTGKGRDQRITQDVRDEGTYNYYDPQKNPIGHTVKDVLPYIFLGNEANDPTTTVGRLYVSAATFMDKPLDSEPQLKTKGQQAVYDILTKH